MSTVNEIVFLRWLASDRDYPVMLACVILAFVACGFVFGGWAVGVMLSGFGMGFGVGLIAQDFLEFRRDYLFRYEFDNWEAGSWTHDTYHK